MRDPWSAPIADTIGKMEQINVIDLEVVKLVVQVKCWEKQSAKTCVQKVCTATQKRIPISHRNIFSLWKFVKYVAEICVEIKSICQDANSHIGIILLIRTC